MRLPSKTSAVCQINNKLFAVDFRSVIEKEVELSNIELAREMGLISQEVQILKSKLSR